MGIKNGNLLYCHGVSEGNVDRKIFTLEYNNRMVYDCFNNPFTDDFVSPALNLPHVTFDDRPYLNKRASYTPDLLPDAIAVATGNYFITLTTTYDSPYILPSDDPNTLYVMNMDVPV